MKLTTTILVCGLAAGVASAQSPSIIQNTRATMQGISQAQTAASNAALSTGDAAPSAASAKQAAKSPMTMPAVKKAAKAKSTAAVPAKSEAKAAKPAPAKSEAKASKPAPAAASGAGSESEEQSVTPDSKYAQNGRRDPFISPVVTRQNGSGCNTGKKCLEIGDINLKGVVHSEAGFIAVVANGLNKAYFLRENDPVFDGYVVKITGDSIVFQETLQDRLGKTFTREVVKKITTPAV